MITHYNTKPREYKPVPIIYSGPLISIQAKVCEHEPCSMRFAKKKGETKSDFNNRKYCSEKCKRAHGNLRAKLMRHAAKSGAGTGMDSD